MYLGVFGHHCRRITFQPIEHFYNLFEFLRVVSCFLEFFDEYPMPRLDQVEFTFACESRYGNDGTMIHGTGGQILDELRRLLADVRHLTCLSISHLLLDVPDAATLLDDVVAHSRNTLKSLQLLNITRELSTACLSSVRQLSRLTRLTVSPTQLNDQVLLGVADACVSLHRLVLVEDRYSEYTCRRAAEVGKFVRPISGDTWRVIRTSRPQLRVRLEYRGDGDDEQLTLPDAAAPVDQVAYDTPWSTVTRPAVMAVVRRFSTTLRVYGHRGLGPRRYRSPAFDDRADMALVTLVRRCSRLTRLVLRDRVSTATIIVLAAEGKSLGELVVRRNAVRQRSDWTKATWWTDEFYQQLRTAARSYDETEHLVSQLLEMRWTMLPDRLFRHVDV